MNPVVERFAKNNFSVSFLGPKSKKYKTSTTLHIKGTVDDGFLGANFGRCNRENKNTELNKIKLPSITATTTKMLTGISFNLLTGLTPPPGPCLSLAESYLLQTLQPGFPSVSDNLENFPSFLSLTK